ncbi:MAG: hypothetical protein ACI4XR_01935, partial [Bacilli bacterium]
EDIMLNKRITKSIRNKVIVGVLVFVTLLGGGIGYKHQQNKINELQYQLEMKQDIDNKNKGQYISIADIESIENEFNKLNSYTVFTGNINLKHTYIYERDSMFGLHARSQMVANASCYYEYKVDLKNANISVNYDTNTIDITLPKAVLNETSVHIKNNTFKLVEKECTRNILMNTRDGQLLQRYWSETFNESAIDKIKEIYDTQEKQEYLEKITKMEVMDLINTLGLNKINVKINIK